MKKILFILIAVVLSSSVMGQGVTPYLRKIYADTITNSLSPRSWSADRKGWFWMEGMRKTADTLTTFDAAENDSVANALLDKNFIFAGTATDYSFYRDNAAASGGDQISINLQHNDGGSVPLTYAAIRGELNASVGAGVGDGEMRFYTHNDANLLERMVIDKDGQVGIGQVTPSARLDIVGTSEFNGDVLVAGASTLNIRDATTVAQNPVHIKDNYAVGTIFGYKVDNTALSSQANGSAAFDALYSSTGVRGIVSANSDNVTTVAFLGRVALQSTGRNNAGDGISIVGSQSNHDFRIYTGGGGVGNERFRILSTGNVGIGSTAPSAKLDVVGASEMNGTLTISDDIIGDGTTFRMDASTNRIGIGISAPSFPLHVIATGISGANTNFIMDMAAAASGGTRAGLLFGYDKGGAITGVIAAASPSSNGNIVFEVGSNDRVMHLDQDGTVGVQTETPSETFHVNGECRVDSALFTPNQNVTLGVAITTFLTLGNVMTMTGDAGANTVATISNASSGQMLTLIFTDANITITDDNSHTAFTVDLSAAFTSADDTVLQLIFNGTSWYEISRSTN